MKMIAVVMLAGLSGGILASETYNDSALEAQVGTQCAALENSTAPLMSAYDKTHHHSKVSFQCGLLYSNSDTPLADNHIEITEKEKAALVSARARADAAYRIKSGIEARIFANHHLKEFDATDPCVHFIGFVLDQTYITESRRPMMDLDGKCPVIPERKPSQGSGER